MSSLRKIPALIESRDNFRDDFVGRITQSYIEVAANLRHPQYVPLSKQRLGKCPLPIHFFRRKPNVDWPYPEFAECSHFINVNSGSLGDINRVDSAERALSLPMSDRGGRHRGFSKPPQTGGARLTIARSLIGWPSTASAMSA